MTEESRAYARAYYRANKDKFKGYALSSRPKRRVKAKALVVALKSVPCCDCGKVYPYYVMDFDHVPGKGEGKKKGNIGTMKSGASLSQIIREAGKCDVVCANCHRIRSHDRQNV